MSNKQEHFYMAIPVEILLKEYEDFTYIISHDLRAPLRHISSFTKILLEDLAKENHNLSDDQNEYTHIILDSVEKVEAMIDSLLIFSRLNTAPKDFKSCETKQLLDAIMHEHQHEISPYNAHITIAGLPKKIYADAPSLKQAIWHLLDNALKFSKDNQTPEVYIHGSQNEDGTTITIEDNGIGLDPRKIEHACLIFKQLDPASPGLGLGLTFAKKILQLNNGSLEIGQSETGGTKAILNLPLMRKRV